MFQFDDRGLIPAIVQDAESGRVLTLAYMNAEALRRTLEGPDVWFYSRSRKKLWHKGETSGNFLKVVEVVPDCDGDAVLVKANPAGPACHTGEEACFYAEPSSVEDLKSEDGVGIKLGPGILAELFDLIQQRQAEMPEDSYTADLFRQGIPRIAQKVVEEGGEVAIASLTHAEADLPAEAADLLYHTLVLLAASRVSPDAVWSELQKRRR